MLLVLKSNDDEELGREAARIVANAVRRNPAIRLGLGHRQHHPRRVQGARCDSIAKSRSIFPASSLSISTNTSASRPRIRRAFITSCANISSRTSLFPRPTFTSPTAPFAAITINTAPRTRQSIRDAGGIDLQILGIGRNGHIGFNEPTSSLGSRTRLKVLTKETIDDNRKFFAPGEEIPQCAITMGIGTILEAKRILLLASGASKATPIAQAIEGPVTAFGAPPRRCSSIPTSLSSIDQAAGAQLKQHDYYRHVLEMTAKLTPDRL